MLPDMIAISGRMRTGKGTLADLLENEGYEQIAFADEARYLALQMTAPFDVDWPTQAMVDGDYKAISAYIERKKSTYRPLLQGMALTLRALDPECMTKGVKARIDIARLSGKKVVVTDCRTWNEACMLKEEGFFLLRLTRNLEDVENQLVANGWSREEAESQVNHSNERELDRFRDWDLKIDTTDTKISDILSVLQGKLVDLEKNSLLR